MKRLIIAGALLCSVAAIKATTEDNAKYLSDRNYLTYNDTVPTDTSKKDTMKLGLMAYNMSDTTPTDTSKKDTMFNALAFAVRDTVPTDTSKKDTTFYNALAFAVRDTVPSDTSRKDSTLTLLALK